MRNLLITLFVIPFFTFAQSPCDAEVCVVQFNAGWNSANNVEWLEKLKDCETK